MLRPRPADVLKASEPIRQAAALRLQLPGSAQIAALGEHRCEIRARPHALRRVDRFRNLDAALEVLDPAEIAGLDPSGANVVESVGSNRVEPELVSHRERLTAETDGLLGLAGNHVEAGDRAEDVGLRGRRRSILKELDRALQVLVQLSAVACEMGA